MRTEHKDETTAIDDEEHCGGPDAEVLDTRSGGFERPEDRDLKKRRHDERYHGEKQHRRVRAHGGAAKAERFAAETPYERRESEHEQQVADDAPGDRSFHHLAVSAPECNEADHEFSDVAERGVQ